MARTLQAGRCCLSVLTLLLILGMANSMELVRRNKRSASEKELDPSMTSYDDDCPNGLIAYEKFNRVTGVFDCAIRTAEICYALCDMVYSANWDITNTLTLHNIEDRDGWYCRALPGYPTKPCFYKPKAVMAVDIAQMYANS